MMIDQKHSAAQWMWKKKGTWMAGLSMKRWKIERPRKENTSETFGRHYNCLPHQLCPFMPFDTHSFTLLGKSPTLKDFKGLKNEMITKIRTGLKSWNTCCQNLMKMINAL